MRILRNAVFALVLALPIPAAAQGWGGMGRRSLGMDTEDLALMGAALNNVLNARQTGGSASWTNPNSGITGTATAQRFFQREGRECADVDADLTSPRRAPSRHYTLVMCQTDQGWKLAF